MNRSFQSHKALACNDRLKPDTRVELFGQSLIEFGLLLPVFLLFIVVVFDLGRAVYYYSAIHNAAREGVRFGAVHPDDEAGMRARAVQYAIGLGLENANVTYAGLGPIEPIGGFDNPTVRVVVEFCFIPVTPLVDLLLPDRPECGGNPELFLTSEAVMRTEILPSP
jgi:hypothetical protein